MDNIDKAIQYLVNPPHPINIFLIGCGATGSEVIRHLARMNGCLIEFGHPGFHVIASDPDTIGPENMFRQSFTEPEISLNKAAQLVSKINRSFGTQWQSKYLNWDIYKNEDIVFLETEHFTNIVISCVDKVSVRRNIARAYSLRIRHAENFKRPLFWMDFGNGFDFGQVILSDIMTMRSYEKPHKNLFKSVFDIYPDAADQIETPSCSLAVSLGKQDLFINSILADLGMRMLWGILRTGKIEKSAIFVNLALDNPTRTALMLQDHAKQGKA